MAAWTSCYSCRDYSKKRRGVIAIPLAKKAEQERRDAEGVVDEFMQAAHERHMAGNPLYPGGPTRVTDPELGRLAALLSPGLFSPTKQED